MDNQQLITVSRVHMREVFMDNQGLSRKRGRDAWTIWAVTMGRSMPRIRGHLRGNAGNARPSPIRFLIVGQTQHAMAIVYGMGERARPYPRTPSVDYLLRIDDRLPSRLEAMSMEVALCPTVLGTNILHQIHQGIVSRSASRAQFDQRPTRRPLAG